MQDADLIKQCKKGDTKQFGVLYDKYIKKIYDFVYYKTSHQETAEDLVSLVFLKALKNIDTFYETKGTFQAWLFQIARNTVIDHYRTAKNDLDIEDVWDLTKDNNFEQEFDDKTKIKEISQYLKGLKPRQREIIIMRVWQEMSYQEIAEILNKSEASCKMMYSRAIHKLRQDVPAAVLLYLILYI